MLNDRLLHLDIQWHEHLRHPQSPGRRFLLRWWRIVVPIGSSGTVPLPKFAPHDVRGVDESEKRSVKFPQLLTDSVETVVPLRNPQIIEVCGCIADHGKDQGDDERDRYMV